MGELLIGVVRSVVAPSGQKLSERLEVRMIRRILTFVAAGASAGTMAVVSSGSLAGQVRNTAPGNSMPAETVPGAEAARAFLAARMAKNWTPPKTPWGDVDLQGNFTNKDEANTPFERPKEFNGRRIADITPDELAAASAARLGEHREKAKIRDQGPPAHFRDSLSTTNSRPWFVIDPPDGQVPPMTSEAQARAAAAARNNTRAIPTVSYKERALGDRCIVNRIVPSAMSPRNFGNSYQILQTPDYVAIRTEAGLPRVIPLDGRPHISPRIRSYSGDSRAHWDGNTLVVVTMNFDEKMTYRRASIKNLRLIERFTRIAPGVVEWTVTLDDPTTWTRPWTYSVPLTEDDTQRIHEYACHEGNYGLANVLSAARAEREQVDR